MSEVLEQENAIVLAAAEKMVSLGQTISEGVANGKQKKAEYGKGLTILQLLTAYKNNTWDDDDLESVLYCLKDLSEASTFPTVSPIVGQELVYLVGGLIRVENDGDLLPARSVINFFDGLLAEDDGQKINVSNTGGGGGGGTDGAVIYCGEWDLSGGVGAMTGGTGAGGAIRKGNQFYIDVGNVALLGPDGGPIIAGYLAQAKVNTPGTDLALKTKWILIPTIV